MIASAILSLLTFGWKAINALSNSDWLLQSAGVRPEVAKFLASSRGTDVLMAVAFALLVLSLVFTYERDKPAQDAEGGKALEEGQAKGQSQPEEVPLREKAVTDTKTEIEAEPEFECRSAKIVRLYLDPGNNKLSDAGSDEIRVSVATVTFYRKPDESPEGWLEVRAHIYFHNTSNGQREEVYDAVWLKNEKPYVTFGKGVAHTLAVAACGANLIATFASDYRTTRERRHKYFAPKLNNIIGHDFRVTVELIGQWRGDVKVCKKFEFRLWNGVNPRFEEVKATEAAALETINRDSPAKRAYIIERLKELIKEDGEVNTGGWVEITDPKFGAGFKHTARVKRFLADYLGEEYLERYKEKGVVALEEALKEFLD